MVCLCHIVPADVLEQLSKDGSLGAGHRRRLAIDAVLTRQSFEMRARESERTRLIASLGVATTAGAATPTITVADCHHGMTLPGTPITNPTASADVSVKNAAAEAKGVYDFYHTVFGRNSIDNAGVTIASSVHYGKLFNNAFWNGVQMTYGDGDGQIFIDFTKGNDVIGHELTHGVTQHSLQLGYVNEAGGLNESLSDVFGSMFRQWQAGQDVNQGDWLIGKDIMGPVAGERGFTCLRDMANPGATHCLAKQPSQFSEYHDGMDPHYSSGIPNLAFTTAAKAIGGKSWEKSGQIWYKAMTSAGSHPTMKMKEFADLTRQQAQTLYPGDAHIAAGVDNGWKAVGL
jgi:Zn-dependent metalloprotease